MLVKGFKVINYAMGVDKEDYDLIVDLVSRGYGHDIYKIVKNNTTLTDAEIADICDRNNFGFVRQGDNIKVYTD